MHKTLKLKYPEVSPSNCPFAGKAGDGDGQRRGVGLVDWFLFFERFLHKNIILSRILLVRLASPLVVWTSKAARARMDCCTLLLQWKLRLNVLPLTINSLYCWLASFPGGCCFVHCKILAVISCHPDNSSFKRSALFHRYPFVIVASRFLQNGKLIFLTTSETLSIQDMRSCAWQSLSSLEWAFVELRFLVSTSSF